MGWMSDHVNIGVSDLAASRSFYERALAPLGHAALIDDAGTVGFGNDDMPAFWISDRPPSLPVHVAFEAVTQRPER